MREIKFRAWNPYQKRMLDPKNIYDLSHFVFTPWPAQAFDYLMQYTGLKDKNGTGSEMCQGDIVNAYGLGPGVVVKNYWGEWGLMHGEDFTPFHDLVMENDLGEIMGNRYDNPELLK